ncbi:radical SAM family heme chaperone HemW [Millionella massiliensis]|uniref:radical SAM family heme chaperone HemW n=1 Tax=Millionella massiliensis TaxID=1871023 RepID=UPI0008D915CA|nr:radical SAM family heme chaperone HemW [Millionella massiliensis]
MSGIYIHIPYCRQICRYCDFHHSASLRDKAEMLRAIGSELRSRRQEIAPGSVRTLYFGGGTPSVCTPEEIRQLVDEVRELWDVERFDEATLEANPDDLTPAWLDTLRRESGIDRLSIGIQSFRDDHLQRMNRRHTAQDAIDAVRNARRAGFDNITIDLIYGLPWMSPDEWQHNLDRAVELEVQHISAYHLTIEPRTVFGKQGLRPVDEETSELHFRMLRETLTRAGFEHYEVSNFARPGFRARHNSAYWRGEPYLGAGPSAHSYDGERQRSWNVSSNRLYLSGAPRETELLTMTDLLNEYLMTRLRTVDGIDLGTIRERFGPDEARRIAARCERFAASGEMQPTDRGFAIPPAHFLVSDYVISELFA